MAALVLMVGLPGAGKSTRARLLAAQSGAMVLTPDEWMIPLFGDSDAGGRRDVMAELDARAAIAQPPPGWGTWADWAGHRWPSLVPPTGSPD